MTSRRDFIRQAALGAAAVSLGFPVVSDGKNRKVIGANDVIRIGVAGVNSRGLALATTFAKMPKCEVAAVCDVDSLALERCREKLYEQTLKRPAGYKDIRKMLESKDIDALVVAMPDHWHATAAIMGLQAGKHVYLEKPTSYCPSENEALLAVAAKNPRRVITVGNQRRSWPNVIEAVDAVRNGEIGRVRFASSWYTANRPSIGRGNNVPVPENLDWDLWQGPAPRVEGFHDNYIHYNWHWFYRWGTGEALNNGTHFVDILRWGLGVAYPTLVTSVGGRFRYHDDWEFPDTQIITYQFGDTAAGSWEGRSCNSTPIHGYGVGVAFYGENGTLVLGGGNEYKVLDMRGNVIKDRKSDLAFAPGDLFNPSEKLDMLHFENWFSAIRTGSALNSTLKDACISTQLVQLGNIAQRTGESLAIDPSSGHILNASEAARTLFTREYEPGWEI